MVHVGLTQEGCNPSSRHLAAAAEIVLLCATNARAATCTARPQMAGYLSSSNCACMLRTHWTRALSCVADALSLCCPNHRCGLCVCCAADLFPDWPEDKRVAFYMDKEQRFRDMAGKDGKAVDKQGRTPPPALHTNLAY